MLVILFSDSITSFLFVFDDGPSYEYVETEMEIEQEEGRSWSSFKYAKLFMECKSKMKNKKI
ncbi:hypothetical protein QTL86_10370 [Cellulosilyticum sp. ST5]|uniref:hypothetical protein n=1 Tax=Cellulosilyticum sp. ST5 TaxID=3055805 RepID=UPI00397740FB